MATSGCRMWRSATNVGRAVRGFRINSSGRGLCPLLGRRRRFLWNEDEDDVVRRVQVQAEKGKGRRRKGERERRERREREREREEVLEELKTVGKLARQAAERRQRSVGAGRGRRGVQEEEEEEEETSATASTSTAIAAAAGREASSSSFLFPGGPGRPPKTAVEHLSKEDLYKQIALVRKQMSRKVSSSQMYIRHLEIELLKRDEEVSKHYDRMVTIDSEFKHALALMRELSQSAGASGGLGSGDNNDNGNGMGSRERLRILHRCVEDLSARLGDESTTLSYIRKVPVPISWIGVAEDVKLMGSFDGWTNGEQLSPNDVTGSITQFSTELLLRPGVYEVKFMVDGRWQLAPDWPMSSGDPVSSNNILVVE